MFINGLFLSFGLCHGRKVRRMQEGGQEPSKASIMQPPNKLERIPMIILHTTHGDISLELFQQEAPGTCANFIAYARDGFYDGTIFHRVIDDFMIQGGGFDSGMRQKKVGKPIRNEADNGLGNELGSVAMARTPDPHSATAQFFINLKNNDFLNHRAPSGEGWGYAVFARVSAGMEVVQKIGGVATHSSGGHQDVPVDVVLIESVELCD